MIALLALTAACSNDGDDVRPSQSPSLTGASATPTKTPATTTAGPTPTPGEGKSRYTNAFHGYTIDYPTGWIVDEPVIPSGSSPVEDAVVIQSFPLCTDCSGEGPIPSGQVKVDIYSVSNPANQSLDDFVAQRTVGDNVTSQSPATISGRSGIRQTAISGEFGSNFTRLFVSSDATIYEVEIAYGTGVDTAALGSVLDSFRVAGE